MLSDNEDNRGKPRLTFSPGESPVVGNRGDPLLGAGVSPSGSVGEPFDCAGGESTHTESTSSCAPLGIPECDPCSAGI